MLLWLVLTIGVNTVRDFLPLESAWRTVFTVHWTLNVNLIGGYLGYFLLGARLARLRRLPSRRVLWLFRWRASSSSRGHLVAAPEHRRL